MATRSVPRWQRALSFVAALASLRAAGAGCGRTVPACPWEVLASRRAVELPVIAPAVELLGVAQPGLWTPARARAELARVCPRAAGPAAGPWPPAIDVARSDGTGRIRVGRPTRPDCRLQTEPMPGSRALLLGWPIDLNRASRADLDALPGIGPGTARRLVELRQALGGFRAVEDLIGAGLGERRIETLRPLVRIGPRPR